MRIYFSGGGGVSDVPEALVPARKPHVMLTFYTIDENRTRDRLKAHLAQKSTYEKNKQRRLLKRPGNG